MNPKIRLLCRLVTILFMTGQFALAYYPGMQFDFKNVKIKRSEKEKMKKFLLEYLVENPQVLKTEKKRYSLGKRLLWTI